MTSVVVRDFHFFELQESLDPRDIRLESLTIFRVSRPPLLFFASSFPQGPLNTLPLSLSTLGENLKDLVITDAELSSVDHLSRLPSLTHLDLSRNKILSMVPLCSLNRLRVLLLEVRICSLLFALTLISL